MYIDEATGLDIRLATGNGTPAALSNIIAHGHYEQDLYDALVDCEWDAEALADVLNANRPMLYAHNWVGIRTLPRALVAQGEDSFGNSEVLYVRLAKGEPDMCEGFSLSLSLTNRSRVPLALSNIVAHGSNEEFKDYIYEAAYEDWSAESLADAANQAYSDGVIYDYGWTPVFTRDDKCKIAGRDSMGNEYFLIIRAS